jgi:hypothetical protein
MTPDGTVGRLYGFSSSCLHCLICRIPFEPGARRAAKLCLPKTLKSSLNLRKLSTGEDSSGCVVYGYNPNNKVELNVKPEDQVQRLEELILERKRYVFPSRHS